MTTNTHLVRSALLVLVVLLSVWPGPLHLIPLACGQDPEPNSITDGLVGYWPLEDGVGYLASDRSGHGNHGILNTPSIPLWQPTGGRVNGALLLDGNGGYVTFGNSQDFDLVKGLTVTAWIKVNAFNKDWQAIVTKGDSAWRLHRHENTNFIDFACNGLVGGNMEWGSTVWGSTSVNDGLWHHVAGVYDYSASMVYLYVDGSLDGPNSVRVGSGGIATNTFDVRIGENAQATGRFWNGLIDDVRIYPTALTASQIYTLVHKNYPPSVYIIANWKLDESSGTIANDSSGNSHHGTLQMGTSPTWEAGKIDGSLFFHGPPDHVNCGNNPIFNITDQLTIAAWVIITGPPADWTGIITKGDDAWRLSTVSNQRRFHFAVTGAPNYWSINGTTEVGLEDEWHHVCGTYDGNFIRLYVDGVEDPASPIAYTGSVSVSPHDVWLSGNSDRQGREFIGLLDELAVWNRALNPYEVEWLFNDGLGNPIWQPTDIYVDDNAPGDPVPGDPDISDPYENGTWEHPFDAIQDAIDVAGYGNTVVVLDGTYTGTGNHDIYFWGMAITVCSRNGPENCIVDCQGGEQLCRGFIFQNGEGADSILDGFTIINGYGNSEMPGGGVACYSSSPTINNCIIRKNIGGMGGGIYCEDNSNPMISNCTISNNIAPWGAGGGIYCGWNSSPTIIDCNINNNIPDGLWIDSYAFIEGTTSFASNNLTGNGTLMIEPNAILDVRDCNVSSNVIGTGTILVPHGKHITVENNAIINLGDPNDLNKNGTLQCNGLLRVKDNAQVTRTNLNVARASFENTCLISNNIITTSAIAPCGQIMVKDTASITSNDIYANGDRYLDLNPSTFAGTIQDNRIFVTITEGTNKTLPALFELRGRDYFCAPPCPPGIFRTLLMPEFHPTTWTIERLELIEGAKVVLTNRIDFQPPYDEGGKYEVAYVKQLILGPNSVLDTAFNRLYYGTLVRHPTANVKNTGLLGFSLGKIDFDDEQKFATCIVHNNFIDIDPEPPDTTRIHVERVERLPPDPTGMMWMRNLRDIDPESPTYGKIISTRAKALFAKCNEEKITIRFEYLFNTFEPGVEMVVYLSDVPDLLPFDDPMRNYHYIEVARIPSPPLGWPGSAGSCRFAVFEKTVFTEELNLREGTCIEVELIEPESQGIRLLSSIDTDLQSLSPGGASAFLDSWSVELHCPGICLDLSGDTVVTEVDFVTVICACGCASELLPDGSGDFVCFEGPFSEDGYIDSYDTIGWDWIFDDETRTNFCYDKLQGVPLSEGIGTTSIEADNLAGFGGPMTLENPSDLNDLLILGKRDTNGASTKLKDRLYVFDSSYKYVKYLSAASERCNIKIVQDPNGQIYQINSETGVRRLDTSHTIIIPRDQISIPSNKTTLTKEPRYNKSATVYVGIKGEGEDAVGRPILDAAFDTAGYIYVVPVVVNPDGNEPYAAAAKLQLISGSPPYKVVKIYDDPPPPSDNQYRNNLREIEIDSAGNLYVLNAHALNESDILWRYYTNGIKEHIDLADPDINLPDPIAMYMSSGTDMLYLGSAQYNPDDSNDSVILGFSTTASLTLTRTITIQDMHHVTGITEDPDSGSLWVVGFNTEPPPDPYQAPFYYPVLANVPLGTINVQAQTLSGLHDLAMPLSILWTKTTGCGGADINGSNSVNFDDFALLSRRWSNTNCAPPSWCYGADLNKSKTVELRDLAILAENWLKTDCQN